jgi:cell division septation protein DedD
MMRSSRQSRIGLLIASGVFVTAPLRAQSSTADSLFEHARKAETPADARRDYLRIIVDFPFSSRAEAALLGTGQIEYESGDKTSARRHLERLASEYADGVTRARGAFWLARVLLDAGESRAACDQLADAKDKVKGSEVEFLGQVNYYAQPCARIRAAAAAAAAAAAESTARADSAARADAIATAKPVKKGAAKRGTSKDASRGAAWSAQVAAYASEVDATALAKKLSTRGFETRVTLTKPYRVRIGRFRTRAEAAEQVQKLRDAKMTAIVVEAEKP